MKKIDWSYIILYRARKNSSNRSILLLSGCTFAGPTVYGDAHLGHARPAITFDLLFRYLKYLGYKVRYVRNITDVGHLTDDSDDGEDKNREESEARPVGTDGNRSVLYQPLPSQYGAIEHPSAQYRASCFGPYHRAGRIGMKKILDNGFAYESDGSIYFDVEAYNKKIQLWETIRPPGGRVICQHPSVRRPGRKTESGRFRPMKKATRNISCAGLLRGVTVFRVGTWNVRA